MAVVQGDCAMIWRALNLCIHLAGKDYALLGLLFLDPYTVRLALTAGGVVFNRSGKPNSRLPFSTGWRLFEGTNATKL